MTQKIVHLGTTPNNMLATVEDIAGWIKEHKIDAMAIIAVDKESNVLSAVFAEDKIFTLLGGIHNVAHTVERKIPR